MARILDELKRLGFHYATRAGVTVSVWDAETPAAKAEILAKSEDKVAHIEDQYEMGLITKSERHRQIVDVWTDATEKVGEAMAKNFEENHAFNPIYMMANSGARGNIKQVRQLAGMRGLMANPKGDILDRPIKANFREGLSVLEYFISTHGARKGLADTALRTADSGYLTRRLVDVAQDVIVRFTDCGTDDGFEYDIQDAEGNVVRGTIDRLTGRALAAPAVSKKTGEVIMDAGTWIQSEADVKALLDAGVESVKLRTVMTCHSTEGLCQTCYGWDLASSRPVDMGTAVGIIAAQSIGEPGTQLTMRTFHTGGVAGEDITHGLPRVTELFEARKPKGQAYIAEISGAVSIEEDERTRTITVTDAEGEERAYTVSRRSRLKPGIENGALIEAGTQLTEGSVNPHDLLAIKGPNDTLAYIVDQVQEVYRSQGVDINDKHIEVIARQMLRKVSVTVAGDAKFLPGQLVDRFEFEQENEKMLAEGLEPAEADPTLLGITKASLATDSYLSAASFQETTRVLTDAAIAGKEDDLLGLKENVIIGKLIPAGTGMKEYRAAQLTYKGQAAEWEAAEGVRGPLPDFAPDELKELEKLLPPAPPRFDEDGFGIDGVPAEIFELSYAEGGSWGGDDEDLSAVDFSQTVFDPTEASSGQTMADAMAEAVAGSLGEGDEPAADTVEVIEEVAEDRCQAITGSGEPCKNKAIEGTRYCRTHAGNAATDGLCKAVMKNGKPCPKHAKEGSDYCGQHAKLHADA
jgi:DNA-directed RNA polymerase subunit beta'